MFERLGVRAQHRNAAQPLPSDTDLGHLVRAQLNESEFFSVLEFRICGEIRERGPLHLRGLWCDGLEPIQEEELDDRQAIVGNAYMMDGPKGLPGDGRWTFYAVLPPNVARASLVDWSPFVPPDDAQGWLEFDLDEQTLTLWLSRWAPHVQQ